MPAEAPASEGGRYKAVMIRTLFVGVFLDHPVQVGVDVRQGGYHQCGQPGKEAAVQPAEGVPELLKVNSSPLVRMPEASHNLQKHAGSSVDDRLRFQKI